jgi:hypothetical protein
MNSCRFAVALLAGLAALAGCAGPEVRAHIDSVNSEYRQLEDYVYCLEDENARLERQLTQTQTNLERVQRGEAPLRPGSVPRRVDETPGSDDLSPPEIVPGTPSAPPTSARPRSSVQRPNIPASSSAPAEKLDLGPPIIEMPGTDDAAPNDLPTPAIPRASAPAAPETTAQQPADTKVTHVFLNPLLTGGADFDRQPGDEGLSIVLEPRNAADQYVPQAGAVSVVVLDPTKEGEAARIARWDFTLTATQQKLQTASAAKGILLEMPWPASPPSAGKLQLFVRYETADGRRLQTDREIFITPPGQVAQRWTPRPADRPITAAAPPNPAPAPTAAPAIVSKIEPTAAEPKLLTPPAGPSATTAPKKAAAPVWSPTR